MVALAQTGQGKQHLISIQKIDANNRNTQALILSPTRELCLQITNEIKTTRNTKRYNVVAILRRASITDQAREIREAHKLLWLQEECKT
jgi:ATP-dependent RNA helicase DeaD